MKKKRLWLFALGFVLYWILFTSLMGFGHAVLLFVIGASVFMVSYIIGFATNRKAVEELMAKKEKTQ